jgi:hypothetical protein
VKAFDLTPTQVKALLKGETYLEVPLPRDMEMGEEAIGREEWRGWNCAGPDPYLLDNPLDETLEKVRSSLESFTSKITKTKEYKEALRSIKKVQAERVPRGGWADIDYRADGLRTRIHGLTLEQTYEAKVVGQIDIGLTRDPWRDPSEMPAWAARFRFRGEKIRRVEGGHLVLLRRIPCAFTRTP